MITTAGAWVKLITDSEAPDRYLPADISVASECRPRYPLPATHCSYLIIATAAHTCWNGSTHTPVLESWRVERRTLPPVACSPRWDRGSILVQPRTARYMTEANDVGVPADKKLLASVNCVTDRHRRATYLLRSGASRLLPSSPPTYDIVLFMPR